MPWCENCNQNIKDSAWRMHQFMCKPKVTQTPVPVVQPVPDPKPEVEVEVEPIQSPIAVTNIEIINQPAEVKTEECASSVVTEIIYPTADPNFMVSQSVADALHYADELSKDEDETPCLLLTGHQGEGKTSLARQLAAITHRPMVTADFGAIQEPQQLFQTTHLVRDGDVNVTKTQESAFIRGIETKRCVVLMDELTRVENERCLNPLMPLLDGRGMTWIDELGRFVKVADGVIFVATINEGQLFCGVSSLDVALRDRFAEIHMPFLPALQEMEIIQRKTNVPESIARTLAELYFVVSTTTTIERKVSTRQMIRAAKYYTKGAPLWHAVELSIGNYNDTAWRQQILEVFSLNIKDETEYKRWMNKGNSENTFTYLV